MRAARAVLLAGVAWAALGAPLAGTAAEPAEGEPIGRYRVTHVGDGVEISVPRDRGIGLVLAAGGALLGALGAGLVASGRRGAGLAGVVVGVGLVAMGALAAFGTMRVRATRAELVRERFAGPAQRWASSEVAAVDVTRRAPSADEFKRVGPHAWDVRLRASDGRLLPMRFTLGSEAEANALARVLSEALGLPAAPG